MQHQREKRAGGRGGMDCVEQILTRPFLALEIEQDQIDSLGLEMFEGIGQRVSHADRVRTRKMSGQPRADLRRERTLRAQIED